MNMIQTIKLKFADTSKAQRPRMIAAFSLCIWLNISVVFCVNSLTFCQRLTEPVEDFYMDGAGLAPLVNLFIYAGSGVFYSIYIIYIGITLAVRLTVLIAFLLIALPKTAVIPAVELPVQKTDFDNGSACLCGKKYNGAQKVIAEKELTK